MRELSYELEFKEDLADATAKKRKLEHENLAKKDCSHIEVTEFTAHYVRDYYGEVKQTLLQKCCECEAYLALDGTKIANNRVTEKNV